MLVHKLAEVRVRVDTPMFIGGYSGDAVQKVGDVRIVEILRPTTLKGLWRWWATAFAAAAAYNAGYDEVAASKALLEYVFGGTEKVRQVSPVQIEVVQESTGVNLISVPGNRELDSIPRVKLMTLGGRRYHAIAPGTKYTINIFVREDVARDGPLLKFAMSTLVTALTLRGFGKASSRGFGSLTIDSIKIAEYYMRELEEFRGFSHASVLEALATATVDCAEALRRRRELSFVYAGLEAASKLLGRVRRLPRRREGVEGPRVRAFVDGFYMIRALRFDGDKAIDVLRCVNECVYQPNRAGQRALGVDQLTSWVLGLPRRVGRTGYDKHALRRASPIVFSVHRGGEGGPTYLTVTAFISTDWPSVIRWKGRHGAATIRVSGLDVFIDGRSCRLDKLVREYFSKLVECVKACVGGGCGKPLDVRC